MKASESRKIDRIIVLASAVVGLVFAILAILKALGFGAQFVPPQAPNTSRGKELLTQAEADITATKAAAKDIANNSPVEWKPVSSVGRDRGFLVSTGLVFRRGTDTASDSIVDLDKPEPQLRAPFPNSYFQKYDLQLEYANVGELDPDKDFFTNEEEFTFSQSLGKEYDPTDAKSHPPLHFLLRFIRFEELPYQLKFTSPNPPSFGLRYETEDREKRWSQQAELGEDANSNGVLDEGEDLNFNGTLDGPKAAGKHQDQDRFLVKGYKKVMEKSGDLDVERIIATFEDTFRPKDHPLRTFELKEGEIINLPVKEAVFEYIPTPANRIQKKEFDKFTLPDTLAPSYLLVELDADKAVLEYQEAGKKNRFILPKGQVPTISPNETTTP